MFTTPDPVTGAADPLALSVSFGLPIAKSFPDTGKKIEGAPSSDPYNEYGACGMRLRMAVLFV